MPLPILIYNPSPHRRKGLVTVQWHSSFDKLGIAPDDLAVFDHSGTQLITQVDQCDPQDPSTTRLLFFLDEEIDPGSDDYSQVSATLTLDKRREAVKDEPLVCEVEGSPNQECRAKLKNKKLEVWLELIPAPWGDGRNWYAGSASTVLLDGEEILDNFKARLGWEGHDPEKRCMQIDQIQLSAPAWESTPCLQISLINERYDLICKSEGRVRASATIASQPFDYKHYDPLTRKNYHLLCKLYRVVSIYRDLEYVTEEIFVKGIYDGVADAKPVRLYFVPRYFTYMDLGLDIDLSKFFRIRDWFAMGSRLWAPFQGYGFATNAHVGEVSNPIPGFPHTKDENKSFSWELGYTNLANCVHLFSRCYPDELQSRIGHAWYEYIYKPLVGKVALPEQAGPRS